LRDFNLARACAGIERIAINGVGNTSYGWWVSKLLSFLQSRRIGGSATKEA
jgi:hypothetical protein